MGLSIPKLSGVNRSRLTYVLIGQTSRMLVQAALFVLLARVLGISEFGAFSAILAAALIISPFSNGGSAFLMVRSIARDRFTAASAWKLTCRLTVLGGVAFSLLATVVAVLIQLPVFDPLVVFLLFGSELVGAKLVEASGFLRQSLGDIRAVAVFPVYLNALRLGALLSAVGLSNGDLTLLPCAVAYFASSVGFGLVVLLISRREARRVPKSGTGFRFQLRTGLSFALGIAAQNTYAEADKALLAQLGSPSAAGAYSAAAKIIEMAYAPVRAVATILYPKYFSRGGDGLGAALGLSKQVALPVMGYGVLAMVVTVVAAPVVPAFLGDDYSPAVLVLQMLSPVLALRACSYLAADALTGSDHQIGRVIIQGTATFLNIGLCIWLIPKSGVLGAVWSTLATELFLALGLWLITMSIMRADLRKQASPDINQNRVKA